MSASPATSDPRAAFTWGVCIGTLLGVLLSAVFSRPLVGAVRAVQQRLFAGNSDDTPHFELLN